MTRKLIEYGIVVALVAVAWYAWSAKQGAEREALIAEENYAAALDSVHLLRVRDSVAYTAALSQVRVALDGALADVAKQRRLSARFQAALAVSGGRVDTVLVGHADSSIGDSGQLVGRVDLHGPPITGSVQATLTPHQPGLWDVRLGVDPIPLRVAVGCRKKEPPELLVTGPEWATVSIGKRELDPAICHPRAAERNFWGRLKVIGQFVAVGTLGYIVGKQ